jgi:flagellar motor switch protein FliN/FliY
MSETEKNIETVDPGDPQPGIDPETSTPAETATPPELSHDAPVNQQANSMDFILDVPLEITVELGRTKMVINDLLKLSQGSVIELSKTAGETLEILANQKLIARGETVVVNDKFGVRLTEIISPLERIEGLR